MVCLRWCLFTLQRESDGLLEFLQFLGERQGALDG